MAQAQEKPRVEESAVISSQELIVWEKMDPAKLFKEGGLDSVLEEIDEKARSIILGGVEIQKDRDNIRAIAAKVSRSKTAVEKIGKIFTEPLRKAVKEANTERDRGVSFLQNLQDDIRKPLTEWEAAEDEKKALVEYAIESLSACAAFDDEPDTGHIQKRLDRLELQYSNLKWAGLSEAEEEKYKTRAEYSYDRAKTHLTERFLSRTKYESDQKELAELREKQAAQEKKDEEGRIRQEAADKATKEADEKARIERESSEKAAADKLAAEQEKTRRAEQDKKDAKAAVKKAEDDRIAAEKKAEKDTAAAVQAEKDRVAAEKQREREEAEKREDDKKHRRKINGVAIDGLVLECKLSGADAESVIEAIADGRIKHVTIAY